MNNAKKQRYYLVYQITNKLNNMIYIGIHVTNNINDNYMGSGRRIKAAIKEHGLENFEKIILYKFDTVKEMIAKEEELVDRAFIAREDTYNVIVGGISYNTVDTVTVKDQNGNCFRVHVSDPRYLSGELFSANKGMLSVKDKLGNLFYVSMTDPRYLSGELITKRWDMVAVRDNNGTNLLVSKSNPRYLSGELLSIMKGRIVVKDKNNNYFAVYITDPRYLSGELVAVWEGRSHTDKTKNKMRQHKGKQEGEKNSQYGTCWIHNDIENKKIKKENLNEYLTQSWLKGRKMKF